MILTPRVVLLIALSQRSFVRFSAAPPPTGLVVTEREPVAAAGVSIACAQRTGLEGIFLACYHTNFCTYQT
jgi:hypothetical protein